MFCTAGGVLIGTNLKGIVFNGNGSGFSDVAVAVSSAVLGSVGGVSSCIELFSCTRFSLGAAFVTLSFAALLLVVFSLSRPLSCRLAAGVPGLSGSSDITPKSSVSLREVGLVSMRVTCNGLGDSAGGVGGCGGGGGGSTGVGRKASEESTQSPTDEEMVAAQKFKSLFKCLTVQIQISSTLLKDFW